MAKCANDVRTPDLFDGRVSSPVRAMPLDVRRRDTSSLAVQIVVELCAWCGVDRAGGCGACSDVPEVTR